MSPKRPAGRAHRTTDRDGVVEVRDGQGDRVGRIVLGVLAALAVVGVALQIRERIAPASPPTAPAGKAASEVATRRKAPLPVTAAPAPAAAAQPGEPDEQPDESEATYEPATPEEMAAAVSPTAREGIAVFPPPGSKRIKPGIIVPEDFPLPPGYMRHYQATDKGEMLPAILMFHPDHPPKDADGNPVAVPADRVVPPEMVPAGMPVDTLTVPRDAYTEREDQGARSPR